MILYIRSDMLMHFLSVCTLTYQLCQNCMMKCSLWHLCGLAQTQKVAQNLSLYFSLLNCCFWVKTLDMLWFFLNCCFFKTAAFLNLQYTVEYTTHWEIYLTDSCMLLLTVKVTAESVWQAEMGVFIPRKVFPIDM